MQISTGNLFPSLAAALGVGIPRDDLVEVIGTRKGVGSIAHAVQHQRATEARHAKNKVARASRRANRH